MNWDGDTPLSLKVSLISEAYDTENVILFLKFWTENGVSLLETLKFMLRYPTFLPTHDVVLSRYRQFVVKSGLED